MRQESAPFLHKRWGFYCARIVNNCALSSGSLLMGLRKGRISRRDYGSGADSRPGTLGGERKNEEK